MADLALLRLLDLELRRGLPRTDLDLDLEGLDPDGLGRDGLDLDRDGLGRSVGLDRYVGLRLRVGLGCEGRCSPCSK